jgi:AcrR family transcriptional regulator
MALFMEHGYRGVSLDAIAAAAGVTKPTLYYHFADKGAILVAVAETMFATARAHTATLLARPDPLPDRLCALAAVVLALPHPFTVFDAVLHEAAGELTAAQMQAIRVAEGTLTALVEETLCMAAQAGTITTDDPILAAHGFLALLRVGQSRTPTGERRFPNIPATATGLVRLWWQGVGSRAPDAPALPGDV